MRAPEPGAPADAAPWAIGAALVLAVVYSPLAHWANASGRSDLAVLAGAALALMLLIEPIARRRWPRCCWPPWCRCGARRMRCCC